MTPDQLRALALALPGVTEADHHGRASFRVEGKVVATVPEEGAVNVMVGEDEARALAEEHPGSCELLWWGRRLSGVRVELSRAPPEIVAELLQEAWHRCASARLRAAGGGRDEA